MKWTEYVVNQGGAYGDDGTLSDAWFDSYPKAIPDRRVTALMSGAIERHGAAIVFESFARACALAGKRLADGDERGGAWSCAGDAFGAIVGGLYPDRADAIERPV